MQCSAKCGAKCSISIKYKVQYNKKCRVENRVETVVQEEEQCEPCSYNTSTTQQLQTRGHCSLQYKTLCSQTLQIQHRGRAGTIHVMLHDTNTILFLAFQSTASKRMRLFARQLLRQRMNGNVTHIMRKFVRRMWR